MVFVVGFLDVAFGPFPRDTEWVGPVLFHAYFVEFATNSLFGMLAGLTREACSAQALVERSVMWLLNIGLVAFVATEIVLGERYGADVMGLGVLADVAMMLYRLVNDAGSPGVRGR